MFGAEELFDCRPIGVGEVIEGAAGAGAERGVPRGLVPPGRSLEFHRGIGGALQVSSSVIAILKVPSTITTTLAPTSSERIFEVMFEPSVPAALLASWLVLGLGAAFALAARAACRCRRAAAAWAARRAAAMKLDVLTAFSAAS